MTFVKNMKFLPMNDIYPLEIPEDTYESAIQQECVQQYCSMLQLEQKKYLTHHPEVYAMLEILFTKQIQDDVREDHLLNAAMHFTRPLEVLEQEVRSKLLIDGPLISKQKERNEINDFENECLADIVSIIAKKNYSSPFSDMLYPESQSGSTTTSSSFLSSPTSTCTPVTPEPSVVPTPTIYEVFYNIISKIVDKAMALHITNEMILYDTAYVEVMKSVEDAMEITVIEIKEDIAALIQSAFVMFDNIILERAEIVAQHNWERRMRKKLKKTLRRLENFRGYEPLQGQKSILSSHESYKKPPRRPCACHPQFHFNRYPKDRFGIYLPREEIFDDENITVTPEIPIVDVNNEAPKETANMNVPQVTKTTTTKKETLKLKSMSNTSIHKEIMDFDEFIKDLGKKEPGDSSLFLNIQVLQKIQEKEEERKHFIEKREKITHLKPLRSSQTASTNIIALKSYSSRRNAFSGSTN